MDNETWDRITRVEFDLEGGFIVTRAVAVVEVVDEHMNKTLKVASVGDAPPWDMIGLLRAGILVQEGKIVRGIRND